MDTANDGVIDWVAVDVAVQDARPVQLTRLERMIAESIRNGTSMWN